MIMPSIPSSPYLKRLYNRFNRLYWKGKLPSDVIVRWASSQELSGQGFNRAPWGIAIPGDKRDPGVILLDSELQRRNWGKVRDLTLLHEMAHIALPKAHHQKSRSKKVGVFRKEMRRLAAIGALDDLI